MRLYGHLRRYKKIVKKTYIIYITFYNETRIQQRLNDQSPVQYRKLIA
ncbi:TPA: IS3 family transposase [Streptococcus agalactiae]